MKTLLFSIIIPTFHRNDLLALCLDRFKPGAQTIGAEYYEVIVTDDGKKGTAKELIKTKYPWAKWVQGPQQGPAANRNNGATKALADWIVFIDDDCVPNLELLLEYQNAINTSPSIQLFEGRIYADRPKLRLDEEAPLNETGGNLWSCNFCISKTLFQSMGGFDVDFKGAAMEDVDFQYRLRTQGYKQVFVYSASVFHPWRLQNITKLEKTRFSSQIIYLNKHPEELSRLGWRFLFSLTRQNISSLVRALFGLDTKTMKIMLLKLLYNAKFLGYLISRKLA